MAGPAQALTTKFGAKPVLVIGMGLLTAGCLWYTQIYPDGSYPIDLLPGFLAVGVGIPFAFIPVTIAALAGVGHEEAGLASGLINTSQQVGGAIGTAVLSTVAFTHADTLFAEGESTGGGLDRRLSMGLLGRRVHLGRRAPRRADLHPPGRGRPARGGRGPRDLAPGPGVHAPPGPAAVGRSKQLPVAAAAVVLEQVADAIVHEPAGVRLSRHRRRRGDRPPVAASRRPCEGCPRAPTRAGRCRLA